VIFRTVRINSSRRSCNHTIERDVPKLVVRKYNCRVSNGYKNLYECVNHDVHDGKLDEAIKIES
jgi:hypothetical protein